MDKTKEEIIELVKSQREKRPFNQDCQKDGNFNYLHQENVFDYIDQAYSAGFEACRKKVEEGVKDNCGELVKRYLVIKTIKEIKE